MTLDEMEAVARAAQEQNPGPWKRFRYGEGEGEVGGVAGKRIDALRDSAPRPDWCEDEEWHGEEFITTDGGHYGPHADTAVHIATFSPDVVLKLLRVARAARGYERHEEHGAELCAALRALDL